MVTCLLWPCAELFIYEENHSFYWQYSSQRRNFHKKLIELCTFFFQMLRHNVTIEMLQPSEI